MHQKNPLHELEKHLMRLSSQGALRSSIIHFGVTTDPFHPFKGKFDGSIKFLELFMRYQPGLLVVQTRSPLIVIAMPVLQKLGNSAAVSIGIETPIEEMVQRYTPGLPRVEERLKAARALKRFGIPVSLQVSPVLPYGDWRRDVGPFAEQLVETADYVYVRPLSDGSTRNERRVRSTTIAKRLAEDRKFHWLRPDSAQPLFEAVSKLKPEALQIPKQYSDVGDKQLQMFVA